MAKPKTAEEKAAGLLKIAKVSKKIIMLDLIN
jgi:hypothetical protein